MLNFFWILSKTAIAYAPVDNLPFKQVTEVNIEYYHNIVFEAVVYRPQHSGYSDALINNAIYASSSNSLAKIESMGLIYNECEKGTKLEIFEISDVELNNINRFPAKYVGNPITGIGMMWGYFDPRPTESSINSIVVTPHRVEENFKILAHEIAHYWYYNFCVYDYTKQTSEEFAKEIEQKVSYR